MSISPQKHAFLYSFRDFEVFYTGSKAIIVGSVSVSF